MRSHRKFQQGVESGEMIKSIERKYISVKNREESLGKLASKDYFLYYNELGV